jgi:hypothetical protein
MIKIEIENGSANIIENKSEKALRLKRLKKKSKKIDKDPKKGLVTTTTKRQAQFFGNTATGLEVKVSEVGMKVETVKETSNSVSMESKEVSSTSITIGPPSSVIDINPSVKKKLK